MDEIDCGSFFDHIDDLLDFPNEDIDSGLPSAADCNSFPSIWTQSESLPSSDSVFSNNSSTDLSTELSVPYEDIVQLEWLSNFVEDSFSGGSLTMNKQEVSMSSSVKKEDSSHNQFQTSSPVSVLESSSSCSGEKTVQCSPEGVVTGKRGRARSKRPRPATFNPRPAIQLGSSTSSVVTEPLLAPKVHSDCENFAESRLVIKIPKQFNSEHKKKKKIKLSVPQPPPAQTNEAQAIRKCLHCEITKTPQWRAGPMGPKTLCNACGVRYKSGRLFPEYRPAASPTFVPSLHSNSHKKVLEMRNKGLGVMTDSLDTELIPNNSNPALDYM